MRRLCQIQAVVTNALAKQRYKGAISIFLCYMDPKHAAPPCSPTPYCLFSLSCLSLSFLPLGSFIRSVNRSVFRQMELKTSTVSPFLNNIALMQMRGKIQEENSGLVHVLANTLNHAPTDGHMDSNTGRKNMHTYTQTGRF